MAKFCTHCGKQNNDTAMYCKHCGAKFDVNDEFTKAQISKSNLKNVPREASLGNRVAASKHSAPQKKDSWAYNDKVPKKLVIIVAVALVAVLATLIVGTVLYFDKSDNTKDTELSTNIDSKTKGVDESLESSNESSLEYIVGETYTVQPKEGLFVRYGPSTAYEELDRYYDLDSYYYANSYETKDDAALLKKGCAVTCERMSDDGKWMKILCGPSYGWICVENNGEVLVR